MPPPFLFHVVLNSQPVEQEKRVRMRKEGEKSDYRQMASLEDTKESKEALHYL